MATLPEFAPLEWIYATLAGDSTLTSLACGSRIYDDQVPQTATFPLVTVRHFTQQDRKTMNESIFLEDTEHVIVAVGRGLSTGSIVDVTVLETIAARIKTLLHRQSGSAARGLIYFCARQRPFTQQYTQNGITYVEVGGIYRSWSQA